MELLPKVSSPGSLSTPGALRSSSELPLGHVQTHSLPLTAGNYSCPGLSPQTVSPAFCDPGAGCKTRDDKRGKKMEDSCFLLGPAIL